MIGSIKDRAAGFPVVRLKPEAIRSFTGYALGYIDAANGTVTPATALAGAHGIESVLIERSFFDQFPQGDPRSRLHCLC